MLLQESPGSNRRSTLFERWFEYDPRKIAEAEEMIRRNRRRDIALARLLFNTPPLGCGYYVNLGEPVAGEKGGV